MRWFVRRSYFKLYFGSRKWALNINNIEINGLAKSLVKFLRSLLTYYNINVKLVIDTNEP